jgi:hypothetical protein
VFAAGPASGATTAALLLPRASASASTETAGRMPGRSRRPGCRESPSGIESSRSRRSIFARVNGTAARGLP